MAPPMIPVIVFSIISLYYTLCFISHFNLFERQYGRGRVVLVTYATSKIGRQVAVEFAKMNVILILADHDEVELDKVRVDCYKAGAQEAHFLTGNYLSEHFRNNMIDYVVKRYGKLNYLIMITDGHTNHNVSAWNDKGNLTTAIEKYVTPNVHIMGLALPILQTNRGYIGAVSTMPGKISLPYLAGVSASKAALQAYFSSLRQELKRDNDKFVSVTSVTIAYMNGIDGDREQGRWGQLFRKYGLVNFEDAVNHAVFAIGGRKKEVTYPFAAQCHSALYGWFQSFYENPQMPSFNSVLSSITDQLSIYVNLGRQS